MPASEAAMAPGHTHSSKSVFLIWESIVMVRNSAWDRKSKFISEMGLSKPEGLRLEVLQGSLNEPGYDFFHKITNVGQASRLPLWSAGR